MTIRRGIRAVAAVIIAVGLLAPVALWVGLCVVVLGIALLWFAEDQ